jgi:predicted transcriptional regulator
MRGQRKRPPIKISEIANALKKTHGLITPAAEMLGVTQQAISARIKASPELQKVLDETIVKITDKCEAGLFKHIKNGNLTAQIFYLKTKGRDRGYIERREVTGQDGGPVKIQTIKRVIVDPRD